jgi:2-C-methyl-D-erythritol 4-phosphate cytidylyltransferase
MDTNEATADEQPLGRDGSEGGTQPVGGRNGVGVSERMTYTLVLLNGGVGARVGADCPKQFIRVNDIPTMVYPLWAVDEVEEITQIVMNYPTGWRDDVERIVRDYAVKTPVTYVQAGCTRQESVRLMLPHCDNDSVLLHESARPLVDASDFRTLIDDERGNVGFMIPLAFTIAPVELERQSVTGYLDRDLLRNVQLPQKFEKRALVAAHQDAHDKGLSFTEDATMCAVNGTEVFFVDGKDRNFKVTSKIDVMLAGYLLSSEFSA